MNYAKWIWEKGGQSPDTYVDFYDTFSYEQGEVSIKISADSNYALYINGSFVNSGQYPDFPHYKVYDEVDITPYLQKGENEIRILLKSSLRNLFGPHHCNGNPEPSSVGPVSFTMRGTSGISVEDAKNVILGKGHEIAVHGQYHKANGNIRAIEGIRDVLDCRIELEKSFGRIIIYFAFHVHHLITTVN